MVAARPGVAPVQWRNQPAVCVQAATGERAIVALQGAQLLSWQTADGVEQLYLSPRALADGRSAIRGGVPLCFPQFNQRVLGARALPKHGFARNLRWQHVDAAAHTPAAAAAPSARGDAVQATLMLQDDVATQTLWPHAFEARITVTLAPKELQVQVDLHNRGSSQFAFALALHTYLRVHDVAQAALHGLAGQHYWDAAADAAQPAARRVQRDALLAFHGETDRVYGGGPHALQLHDSARRVALDASATLPDTIVWTPGAALGATLADLPPEGWRHFVCVEAGCIDTPVQLAPGAHWSAWQRLRSQAATV
ncbi:MAG: D-hexose-6-phosphate mutarotase [Betaproteobacteria bacterium]|nr:D-hexose-6-phosphate mutarotase [Betaproteobacteria bacterium]